MEEALLTGCRADFSDKWNEYERHLNMIVSGHAVAASHQIIRAKPAQRCKAWALTMEPE
jgi:hypothetical protein